MKFVNNFDIKNREHRLIVLMLFSSLMALAVSYWSHF